MTFKSALGILVSKCGRVVKARGKERKFTERGGYLIVYISKNGKRSTIGVHQLVALAWIGPQPPGQQVCHIDGNKKNNHVNNLRYGSPFDNAMDAIRHGRRPSRQVRRSDGHIYPSVSEASRQNNVSRSSITEAINNGWKSNSFNWEFLDSADFWSPIRVLRSDGEHFESCKEAARSVKGSVSAICEAISGSRLTYKGFSWSRGHR